MIQFKVATCVFYIFYYAKPQHCSGPPFRHFPLSPYRVPVAVRIKAYIGDNRNPLGLIPEDSHPASVDVRSSEKTLAPLCYMPPGMRWRGT